MKKALSILLCLCLVLSVFTAMPFTASAATLDETTESVGASSGTTGDCTWTLSGDGVLTISGNGRMGDYYGAGYYPIDNTFSPWDNWVIRSIIIENGVKSIGVSAFYGCGNLTSITIPNSIESIGDAAFKYCNSLVSINIPDSVTSIGNGSFYDCNSLTNITLGNSVTSIGAMAFEHCDSLTSVTIGNSVKSIGSYAFEDCTSLSNLNFSDSVTYIGNAAFRNTSLSGEIINDVEYFGKVAYRYTGSKEEVTTVAIKQGTKGIAVNAFGGCEALTTVTMPTGLEIIGEEAFIGCEELQNIKVPDGVKFIGGSAFRSCYSLTDIHLPDSVETIGQWAFYYSGLQSITIPYSVTSVGYEAFHNTQWYNNLPNEDIYLGKVLYEYKGHNPLATSIIIKGGTTEIAPSAFANCSNLKQVTIPDSVKKIGSSAFYECRSLTSIGNKLGNSLPDNLTEIGSSAFSRTGLTNISIPGSVETIGDSAFSYSDLKSVNIIDGVKKINDQAFNSCRLLKSVSIPSSVTLIGIKAFNGCELLENINVPDKVTCIGSGAFEDCKRLQSVSLGCNVTNIFSEAFKNCTKLTSIIIPDSIRNISSSAFENCTGLTSIHFGNNIKNIGKYAFRGCTGLTSVVIPKSVYQIGYGAFHDCGSIQDAFYYGSEDDWKKIYVGDENDDLLNVLRYNSHVSINVLGEVFSHDLKYFAKAQNSTQFSPELAHLMMTFANAAYTKENIKRAYSQLGLWQYDSKYYDENFAEYGTEKAPFNVGYVVDDSGTKCVLVTIRGSGNPFDASQGTLDWLGNISLKAVEKDGYYVNENFYNTMRNIYSELDSYIFKHFNQKIEDLKNTKFFITGHSRGAAVGNLLEKEIGKAVGKEHVYGYNFAVPDSVYEYKSSLSQDYENIFNLSHIQDVVSYLPSLLVFPEQWTENTDCVYSKHGITVWFDDGQLDSLGLEAHVDGQKYYINYLRNRYPLSSYITETDLAVDVHPLNPSVFTGRYKVYSSYCPVDVELVDENGTVIASIVNGEVDYHDSHFGEIVIVTEGDHKSFAVPANSNYSLRLIGSDAGTMDYYISEVDIVNREVVTTKGFEGVSLVKGKEMYCPITDYSNANDTQLFVLNENSITQEILTNGTEVNPIFASESKLILPCGASVTLTAESKDAYRWYSTDENVATVENGVVTIHTNGEANIIAETVNGARAICHVSSYVIGDTDNDSIINIRDVTAIQRHIAELNLLTEKQLAAADTNGDGKVDINDATHLQMYLAEYNVVLG